MVGECDMTESARRAATFKILRAIGIDLTHKQAFMVLIPRLRNWAAMNDDEDFSDGSGSYQWCYRAQLCFRFVAYSYRYYRY